MKLKDFFAGLLFVCWLTNTILGNDTEASVYLVGATLLLFMPDEKE